REDLVRVAQVLQDVVDHARVELQEALAYLLHLPRRPLHRAVLRRHTAAAAARPDAIRTRAASRPKQNSQFKTSTRPPASWASEGTESAGPGPMRWLSQPMTTAADPPPRKAIVSMSPVTVPRAPGATTS